MHELQAQAMEAAGIRLLEELTGLNLATFEDIANWRSVDNEFDRLLSDISSEEHHRAIIAVWSALFQDPALVTQLFKLNKLGYLDSMGSMDLYYTMVYIPTEQWAQRIDGYLTNPFATVATAKSVVRTRLAFNLAPADQPSYDFSKVGLDLP